MAKFAMALMTVNVTDPPDACVIGLPLASVATVAPLALLLGSAVWVTMGVVPLNVAEWS
jgi:hypothetical protein